MSLLIFPPLFLIVAILERPRRPLVYRKTRNRFEVIKTAR